MSELAWSTPYIRVVLLFMHPLTKFHFPIRRAAKVMPASIKGRQHPDFPGGHPPEYYPSLRLLNFAEQTGYGAFSLRWPSTPAHVCHRYSYLTLTHTYGVYVDTPRWTHVDTDGSNVPGNPPKSGLPGWVDGYTLCTHFEHRYATPPNVRHTRGELRGGRCGTHRPNVWPAFIVVIAILGYPTTYNTTCTMPHHGYTHTHPTPCRADSPVLHIHAHAPAR